MNTAVVAVNDKKLVWSITDIALPEYSARDVQVADEGYHHSHSNDTGNVVGICPDAFTDIDPHASK